MKIIKIRLKNYRQYKDQTIYFPQKGLIGIVGVNGSGKSTLLSAIEIILFGKKKKVKKSMFKNQNINQREKYFGELDFYYQGKFHRIRRHEDSSKCFVQIDGKTKAEGTTNINEWIQNNIFKMDQEAFNSSYYAEQDDFDKLVKLNDGPRVEMLSKLLRIDSIEKAAKKARDEYRKLDIQVNESKSHLKNKEDLLNDIELFKSDLESLQNLVSVSNENINQIQEEQKQLILKRDKLENDSYSFQKLKSQEEQLLSHIEYAHSRALSPSIKRLQFVQDQKERYESQKSVISKYEDLIKKRDKMIDDRSKFESKQKFAKDIKKAEEFVKDTEKEISLIWDKESSISVTQEEIIQNESLLNDLNDKFNSIQKDLINKENEIANKRNAYKELMKTQDKFTKLGSEAPCPVCERPLAEHYEDKMNHLSSEAEVLQSQGTLLTNEQKIINDRLTVTSNEISSQKAVINELRELSIKKGKYIERLRMLKRELEGYKDRVDTWMMSFRLLKDVTFDIESYQALLTEINSKKPLYEDTLSIKNSAAEIPELKASIKQTENEISQYNEDLANVRTALSTLDFDQESFKNLKLRIEENQVQLQKHEKIKNEHLGNIRVAETEIKNTKAKLSENERLNTLISNKEDEMTLLSKLDEVLKAYKNDKLRKLKPAMSEIMSELIDVITSGKYDRIDLDEKYNIYMYRKGIRNHLNFYSGGEEKLAAICQRLAISNILVQQTGQGKFEMLAMDEAFSSMDNSRQDSMIDMLRNLNSMFSQILIVTHSENVKELFDYVLEIETDEEDFSTAKWSTPWNVSEIEELSAKYSQ